MSVIIIQQKSSSEFLISQKSCRHCQSSFDITDRDMEFYSKISPTFDGQKYAIPTPTLCPDCRQMRRLSFRNERNLYKRKCDASGKDIISIYSPDKPHKVYDQKIRRSDVRDPMDYGKEFDFSRSFSEQFGELMREVPLPALSQVGCENSDYTNLVGYTKNCYMLFASKSCENSLYSAFANDNVNITDCTGVSNCQESYQLVESTDCYKVLFSFYSTNCNNCLGIVDCHNCTDCIICSGLDYAKYMIKNIQYSKEEFERKQKEVSYNEIVQYIYTNKISFETIYNSENSQGRFLNNTSNCFGSSFLVQSEDCKYCSFGKNAKDCYDTYAVYPGSVLSYDSVVGINGTNNYFGFMSTNSNYTQYCFYCDANAYLFGCIGLRNKSYCIFNKQYTKEEYEILVPKIIDHMTTTGEWGEFFHPSLSPFGYNETVAQEDYPLQKVTEVSEKPELKSLNTSVNFGTFGYTWNEYISPAPISDKIIDGKDLPASIEGVDDDIFKTAVKCEISGKLFRIIPQELAFYRKHGIPVPRKHPDVRHAERMALRK